MDLLVKTIIIAVVIIALIVALSYFLLPSLKGSVSKQQAESLVLADLQNSNPGAQVNITNVTPSQYQGSWHIVSSVVLNATTPCPSYYIYSFDYPQYRFVYRVDNIYTENCTIPGYSPGSGYIISSYPVAIVRAYNLMTPQVRGFISKYGYSNTAVHAHFESNATLNNTGYGNVWVVNYTSKETNRSVIVAISQLNGTLLTAYNQS